MVFRFLQCFMLLSFLAPSLARAQDANAQATPVQQERAMTREERIKAHQERIERIIQENRQKKEEQEKAAAQAQGQGATPGATPAPGAPPGAPGQPGQPGQALPAGPVQPAATMTPPIQNAQQTPPAQAPTGARSESRTILHFRPMDNVVNVAEVFETEVVAETKDGAVDEVAFLVNYPERILNPLAIDHSALDALSTGSLDYAFDPEAGEIYVRGKLSRPMKLNGQPILKIVWEALAPTSGAAISFRFDRDYPTGLFLKGTNLLGTVAGAEDGIIASTVMVKAPRAKTVVQELGGGLAITSADIQPPPPTMRLRLEPPARMLRAGERFKVDVLLDNAAAAPLDNLQLVVRYNPDDVEVVDVDKGNAVRRGINIEDGFAVENFDFDFYRTNEADNSAGVLRYSVASNAAPVRASGKLATIHFRAKRSVTDSILALMKGPAGEGTEVTYLGTNMLAPRPWGAEEALQVVNVGIMPPLPGATPVPAQVQSTANPFKSRLGTSLQF